GRQGVVAFDLDDQVGVGQAKPVAGGGAEHFRIGAARYERALHQAAESEDAALAADGDQFHRALLAGFETHRGARDDVEPHAMGGGAVEAQGRIGLGEVVVRADLDGPVAGVAHHQGQGGAAGVESVCAL
ncbi:hypothetical protein E4T56_gene19676, partial [Termitomyces sp. T112]